MRRLKPIDWFAIIVAAPFILWATWKHAEIHERAERCEEVCKCGGE